MKHDMAIDRWIYGHTRPLTGVSGFVKMEEEQLRSLLRIYYNISEMLDDLKKVGS